jgi:hypothetical protein
MPLARWVSQPTQASTSQGTPAPLLKLVPSKERPHSAVGFWHCQIKTNEHLAASQESCLCKAQVCLHGQLSLQDLAHYLTASALGIRTLQLEPFHCQTCIYSQWAAWTEGLHSATEPCHCQTCSSGKVLALMCLSLVAKAVEQLMVRSIWLANKRALRDHPQV